MELENSNEGETPRYSSEGSVFSHNTVSERDSAHKKNAFCGCKENNSRNLEDELETFNPAFDNSNLVPKVSEEESLVSQKLERIMGVIDDLKGKELSPSNVVHNAKQYRSVEESLSACSKYMAPLNSTRILMNDERASFKKLGKSWDKRTKKAQEAADKALKKGLKNRHDEYIKLRDIASRTSTQMKNNSKLMKDRVEHINKITHDMNMAVLNVSTLIVSCNQFILGMPETENQAEAARTILANTLSKVSELESAASLKEITS